MSCLFDEVVKEGEANVPLLVMHVRNYLVFSTAHGTFLVTGHGKAQYYWCLSAYYLKEGKVLDKTMIKKKPKWCLKYVSLHFFISWKKKVGCCLWLSDPIRSDPILILPSCNQGDNHQRRKGGSCQFVTIYLPRRWSVRCKCKI